MFFSLCCPCCKKSFSGVVTTTTVCYSALGLLISFAVKTSGVPRSAIILHGVDYNMLLQTGDVLFLFQSMKAAHWGNFIAVSEMV